MNGSASLVRAAGVALACAIAAGLTPAGAAGYLPGGDRAIVHALNRLAFGARPGDVQRVREMGLENWIERQLHPDRIAESDLEARLARLTTIGLPLEQRAEDFVAARRESVRRQRERAGREEAGTGGMDPAQPGTRQRIPPEMRDVAVRNRQALQELAEAKILRAVYSERQLEEVLVDFWFNHFNVFARKGQTQIYVGAHEREAIRPHVLGRFRDLLGATAHSPAMLVYLDNWLSADPGAASPFGAQRAPRPGARGARTRNQQRRPESGVQQTAVNPAAQRRTRGLNENYARELLELHTLSVDGGYTQQDVVEVARAFTGWTVGRPGDPGFRFAAALHDRGEKKVLGHTIAAGGGIDDGEKVLDILARHPSTARHIATRLAQRFVSDTPPRSIVDAAARTFARTGGNLREVVRTIITSDEFFAPDAYRAKVKTPFEFVASALRATGAEVQSAQPAVRALGGLGMPLYLCQPPTGYDEASDAWVSSGALVGRMNFAVALAGGELRGITVPGAAGDAAAVRAHAVREALADDLSRATLEIVGKATSAAQAIALTIGAPEFQRQ